MGLDWLRLENFRCHEALDLRPEGRPWVVLAGRNGTGKTSLLEAVYGAARGRSFRRATGSEMIRAGSNYAAVVLECSGAYRHTLGARYEGGRRYLRLDGAAVRGLAELSAAVPVDYMGGMAHRLVDGSPTARRKFLDWCLFHVEPRFLGAWRSWHRAHRQRNEWLRQGGYPASTGWTQEVIQYGEQVSAMRAALVENLDCLLDDTGLPRIGWGNARLKFKCGWGAHGLRRALEETGAREKRAGRAVVGPQQDDWALSWGGMETPQLSRGQTKLASFYLWNVRARVMRAAGRSAILLADDFMADLDEHSSRLALEALQGVGGQIWVVVHAEDAGLDVPGNAARFHVEPGRADAC